MGTTETSQTSQGGDDAVSITDDVRGAEYYHGLIPRMDAEPLLKREGDFLLRKTEHSPGMIVLALSCRTENGVKHFMINQDPDGSFYFEHHHEKTIADLIAWHFHKNPIVDSIKRSPSTAFYSTSGDKGIDLQKLGEGAFGEVYLAEYGSGKNKQEVAVKTMRNEATREARLKFMKEARLMRKYNHKHVVKILGVAVHEHPLMLVMEVCPNGSLASYLRKNRGNISQAEKLRFSTEASDGLAYLAKKQCIHRDIAARNCLLGANYEIKIADFGMSDDKVIVHDDTLEKVPVKWLAPETLQDKIYSLKTDVWSYGVLVWEIYAEGAEPYPGLTRLQTRAKIVVQNYRMEMPKDTPKNVAEIVYSCWERDPARRPEMVKIFRMLREIGGEK
ncbi:unnamed protein product [Heligmosomoides polygyrus]|uniref:Tyrosine-protein kinase n=1 Tax=Heligmosomoides polygyrus TaxID=6339 RepID=A0A3P7YV65_HELPZ|nr:unnamed protein product [Heligmosomoides polygyrus]